MTIARITPVEMLLSKEPIVSARCLRRSWLPGRSSDRKSPARLLAMTLVDAALAGANHEPVDRTVDEPAEQQSDEDDQDDGSGGWQRTS